LHGYGFTSTIISKATKELEKSGSIKSIKSLEQKNKVVYMSADVEPSSEVTGGLVTEKTFSDDTL